MRQEEEGTLIRKREFKKIQQENRGMKMWCFLFQQAKIKAILWCWEDINLHFWVKCS
jgi:hypothetical protein